MPKGFFTIEQWQPAKGRVKARWHPILHRDGHVSLTASVKALEKRAGPGLFRVVQTQRCLWGEMVNGKLRLHGSHVLSVKGLIQLTEIYQREGGRWPVEKARRERAAAKAGKKP
jgi:hypothetical protein